MKEKAQEIEHERENESKWEREEKEGVGLPLAKKTRRGGKGSKLDIVEQEKWKRREQRWIDGLSEDQTTDQKQGK